MTDAGSSPSRVAWTLVLTSAATFMAALDNLVVTTALPVIRADLNSSLTQLEWVVNGYTLPFACLLLLAAALGDRHGRRRVFIAGIVIFTLASATAALATDADSLIAARALQGAGAAAIVPLTLTLISTAVPAGRRGMAFGIWGAVNGMAIASGPLVGGVIAEHASWQWIFWLNVPIGILLVPMVYSRLAESRGPNNRLDVPGTILASAGIFGVVLAIVRGAEHGWTSSSVVGGFVVGTGLLVAFVWWELRTSAPILPMRFFKNRGFAAINVAGLLMFFGAFGSIFLLTQFLQLVQNNSPQEAGLRMLPWTAMPMVIAPLAGALSDRIGGRPIVFTGFATMAAGLAWFATVAEPAVGYAAQVPAFVLCGAGMAMFFAPASAILMISVRPSEHGIASGVNNSVREVGGALGVAVLASVFSANGGYETPQQFTDGLVPALWIGAVSLVVAALAVLWVPRGGSRSAPAPKEAESQSVPV